MHLRHPSRVDFNAHGGTSSDQKVPPTPCRIFFFFGLESHSYRSGLVFWFLVCFAATQQAIQLHQERIQVVRSNRVAWKRPTESNSTPAMDLGFDDIRKRKYTGFDDIRKRKYTNKRGINTAHIHKHAVCRKSLYTKKELMLYCILLLYLCVQFSLCFGMNPDYYHVVDLFGY